MSGTLEALRSIRSRQFAVWVGVFTVAFTVSVTVLDVVEAPTIVVFVAGLAFGEVADRAVGRFTDWYLDDQDVEGRAAA